MTPAPSEIRPTVFVVEDDAAVRGALALALDLEGFAVELCTCGEALLLKDLPGDEAFLVIDQRLPGVSGLDTLEQLRSRGVSLPAAFITSHPKPLFSAAAAAAGVPILEKPLLGETLVAAVHLGLDAARRASRGA